MTIKRETRNDFTVSELNKAAEEGQTIDQTYVLNPDYAEQYEAWRKLSLEERRAGNAPSYYLTDESGEWVVAKEELVDIEDYDTFWGEPYYLHGLGDFESVGSWNLGDGHERGVVFKHVQSGRHFMKTGYYSSWDSSAWDADLTEVTPVEVTVTRFKDVNSDEVFKYPIKD